MNFLKSFWNYSLIFLCLCLCASNPSDAVGEARAKRKTRTLRNTASSQQISLSHKHTQRREKSVSRENRKFGILFGLSYPFPSLGSLAISYYPIPWLKTAIGLGYSDTSLHLSAFSEGTSANVTALTYGGCVQAVYPKWEISPTLGFGVAHVSYKDSGILSGVNLFGKTGSYTHAYTFLGIDWHMNSGFQIGLHYNQSFDSQVNSIPTVTVGFYI